MTDYRLADGHGPARCADRLHAIFCHDVLVLTSSMPIRSIQLVSAPAGATLEGNVLTTTDVVADYHLSVKFGDGVALPFRFRAFERACRRIGALRFIEDDNRVRELLGYILIEGKRNSSGYAADLVRTNWQSVANGDEYRVWKTARNVSLSAVIPGSLADAQALAKAAQA